ncbi:TPA: hypothetical protein I7743_09860 [Vibrio vulnificus]|nr:hypothetical protein [Vibrio vulnificus]
MFQKVEIKNRIRFEKIDRNVKPNLENFSLKSFIVLIKKMDNTLHQLFIKKLISNIDRKLKKVDRLCAKNITSKCVIKRQ